MNLRTTETPSWTCVATPLQPGVSGLGGLIPGPVGQYLRQPGALRLAGGTIPRWWRNRLHPPLRVGENVPDQAGDQAGVLHQPCLHQRISHTLLPPDPGGTVPLEGGIDIRANVDWRADCDAVSEVVDHDHPAQHHS
jgi:hypothetical protein